MQIYQTKLLKTIQMLSFKQSQLIQIFYFSFIYFIFLQMQFELKCRIKGSMMKATCMYYMVSFELMNVTGHNSHSVSEGKVLPMGA